MIRLLSESEAPLQIMQCPDVCRMMLNRMIELWQQTAAADEKQQLAKQIQKVIVRFQKQGVFLEPDSEKSATLMVTDGSKEYAIQFHEGLLCLSSDLFAATLQAKMQESRDKKFDYKDRYSKETIELFRRFVHEGTLPVLGKMGREEQVRTLNELLDFAHYIQRPDLFNHVLAQYQKCIQDAPVTKKEDLAMLLQSVFQAARLAPQLTVEVFLLIERYVSHTIHGFVIQRRPLCLTEYALDASQIALLDATECAELLQPVEPDVAYPGSLSNFVQGQEAGSKRTLCPNERFDWQPFDSKQRVTRVLQFHSSIQEAFIRSFRFIGYRDVKIGLQISFQPKSGEKLEKYLSSHMVAVADPRELGIYGEFYTEDLSHMKKCLAILKKSPIEPQWLRLLEKIVAVGHVVDATDQAASSASSSSSSSSSSATETSVVDREEAALISSAARQLVRRINLKSADDIHRVVTALEMYEEPPGANLTSFTIDRSIPQEGVLALIDSLVANCPNLKELHLPFIGSELREISSGNNRWYLYETDTLGNFLEKTKPFTHLKQLRFSHPQIMRENFIALNVTESFIEAMRKAPSLQFSDRFEVIIPSSSSLFKDNHGGDIQRIADHFSVQRALQQYSVSGKKGIENQYYPGHCYIMFSKNPNFSFQEGGFENGTLKVTLDVAYMSTLDKISLEYDCEIELLVDKESKWFVKEYNSDIKLLTEKLASSKTFAKYAFKANDRRDYGAKKQCLVFQPKK